MQDAQLKKEGEKMITNKKRIAVLAGDGIGPEIMKATLEILSAAGFEADAEWLDIGLCAIEKGKEAVPEKTLQLVQDIGIALKGPTTTPKGTGHSSANVQLRRELDLYANVRPILSIGGIVCPLISRSLDMIVVRENTEGLYAGFEFQPHPDVTQAVKVITRQGCERLMNYTFEMARKQNRKKVTVVHKANIMKLTDGMMLEEFYRVSMNYPEIEANDIIVDNCCMQLVTRPSQFDVIVTENLYGDIVSDLCAGLIGGLGLAPSANIGEKAAVFEAVHGSAPDIAGKGIANPTALLMSSVMMLKHIGFTEIAEKILHAINEVCKSGEHLTPDMGGTANTQEYTQAIIKNIETSN